jgi:hypothetical protein
MYTLARVSCIWLVCILYTSTVYGQLGLFGVKAGLNLSSITHLMIDQDKPVSSLPKIGLHIGGFADYTLSDSYTIRVGLGLSGLGGVYSDTIYSLSSGEALFWKERINLTYLEIPLSFQYSRDFDEFTLNAGCGPYAGIGLIQLVHIYQPVNARKLSGFNQFPFDIGMGFSLGMEQEISDRNLGLEIGYRIGFLDLYNSAPSALSKKQHNRSLQFSLVYRFPLDIPKLF